MAFGSGTCTIEGECLDQDNKKDGQPFFGLRFVDGAAVQFSSLYDRFAPHFGRTTRILHRLFVNGYHAGFARNNRKVR